VRLKDRCELRTRLSFDALCGNLEVLSHCFYQGKAKADKPVTKATSKKAPRKKKAA
jgi:hypothetical protein